LNASRELALKSFCGFKAKSNLASIDGNGSIKATATALCFLRIPILTPRYIRLDKRGIFRVAVEEKFGNLQSTKLKRCFDPRQTAPTAPK
jgi:hypothetical protein